TQGDPATLQVKFSGTKEITARWFKDGQELTLGQKYKISVTDTVSILKIISTEKRDSGEYTFEVQNDVGRSSCKANLIIPPSFTKRLKKMDSIKGSSIDLECIVAGSHPISIQWFKDDQEISASEKYKFSFHDNTAFLEISHLEGSDSGTYTCSATNKAGHNQCSGHLTVKEPPYFVEKPQSQDVNPSTRVQLKALVGGTAPMTIKWFKDNKEFSWVGGGGRKRLKKAISAFVLKKKKQMFNVTLSSPSLEPPQFIKKPSPVLVLRNGQSTTFECQITGTPEIRVSWYLDGNEITAIKKHGISFIDGLATFQISGARVENSGTYVCEARNDAGTASCSIELKVKEPPTFIRELKPVEVVKDSDVQLECEVAGTAPFEVTWLRNNKEIRSSKKYTLTDRVSVFSLHITKCDPSDTGDYQCIVSNEGGSCSKPPSFIKKIENVTTVLKSSGTFQSTVAGSPPISITWLKDDHILEEDDNVHISFVNNVATLQIRAVDNGHSGRYTCQAKNESGVERCYAFLLVQGL
uniref:Ig-like domain-containing protein n=1 Tax=Canis lupus dingo TaxID=286419 RepID=A0A8C0K262_CANLU